MIKILKCARCGIPKSFNEFMKRDNRPLGISYHCKACENIRKKNHRRTKEGLISLIYKSQRTISRRRNHPMPSYSVGELKKWVFEQHIFHLLYNNWKEGGFQKCLAPSCDRKDDYKSYTIDNLQLMTWQQNNNKAYRDRINGINNKTNKAVIGIHKNNGHEVTFYSMSEAFRRTGICNISSVCLGKTKSAGGYIWKFKNQSL